MEWYLQLESNFKRQDVQFCAKECARGVRDRVLQRATRICRYFLCSSLLSSIVEIKSLLVAYGVHVAFWTLIGILIQSGRTLTHSGSRRPSSGKVQTDVCETKTFESDTRSIIDLELAQRALENTVLIFLLSVNGTWILELKLCVQCTSRRFGTILLC